MKALQKFLRNSKTAQAIVARHGIAAWLVFFCAALMSFLMLYTTSLASATRHMADNWRDALDASATLRIQAPQNVLDKEAAAVENLLRTTPSILEFKEVGEDEQLELLAPWLGDEIPVEVLTLPKIYAVTVAKDADQEAIKLRLSAEAPHAIWDDHNRWRGPLIKSATRIEIISWISTILIGTAFVLLIFLAAEAAISANARSITLLRQIGGSDAWIKSGFERKLTLRSFFGSLLGVALGLIAYRLALQSQLQNPVLTSGEKSNGLPWVSALIIVILCALMSLLATHFSTKRYLRKNT